MLELYDWQKSALTNCIGRNNFAIFAEMGTGKTLVMINTIIERLKKEPDLKVLIISVPIVLSQWKNEFHKFFPDFPQQSILVADAAVRKKRPDLSKYQIVVTNYSAFSDRKKGYDKFFGSWSPGLVCADESQKIKTYSAICTKNVIDFCKYSKYKYIMSGTPILNSPLDAFSQYKFLDNGETLGDNYYVFKARYFYDIFAGRGLGFPKLVPIKQKIPELSNLIMSKACRVMLKDCKDLPDLIKITIPVEMHPKVRQTYKEIKEEFLSFVNEKAVVAQTAVVKAIRLLQVASGHVVNEDDEVVPLPHNNKLDKLEELIDEVLEQHSKLIIWTCFKYDVKIISELLERKKLKFCMLTGAQSTKEKGEEVERFQNGDAQVCLANAAAAGVGVNLTAASVSIIFSRNFNLGDYLQSTARNYRSGSEIHPKIVQYTLAYENSIDINISQVLDSKETMSYSLLASTIASFIKDEI